ncbi:hypothetical protein AMTR_s00098p00158110 [Amborella trichopoda]|uniref:Uncharacterized protein n=1 Tax=Amborella trichopoda TaxID=13333 RepID=W1NX45_AMBTC|nr:hypothetical protein AMTR_s00098p00158110 [Amborella trichopoda]
MGVDFDVPIGVVLEEIKLKKSEEKARKAREVTKTKKNKDKMEQTPVKKMKSSKKKKEGVNPFRSSSRIASIFGLMNGTRSSYQDGVAGSGGGQQQGSFVFRSHFF